MRQLSGDLVGFTVSPTDDEAARGRSLVYDARRRVAVELPGEAYVAGPWLLWAEVDRYRPVRMS